MGACRGRFLSVLRVLFDIQLFVFKGARSRYFREFQH